MKIGSGTKGVFAIAPTPSSRTAPSTSPPSTAW